MTAEGQPNEIDQTAPRTPAEQADRRQTAPARPGSDILVRNLGEPVRLTGVNLCGVTAEPAQGPGQVKVWTKLALTSDHRVFHRIVENLDSAIAHFARQAGSTASLRRADMVLLVVRPDDTAELWIDAAAVAIQAMVKRNMDAGAVVFENDIADVTGMSFPLVKITSKDRVLCLFRQDWRFGLFFDFNPERNLNLELVTRSLGTLYRSLKYRHIYDTIADQAVFDRLISSGWFPFVEIIGNEFQGLADSCESGFDFSNEEAKLVAKFDRERLDRMLARWVAKPHFKSKAPILDSALRAFEASNPIAAIKITLTEIEGVLAQAYQLAHGRGAKIKTLLEFAISSAERKSGGTNTLLFPSAFAQYLAAYTFANFDPTGPAGSAGSRHAVGHGAADAQTYTQARALQALLTLDQLAFYT